MPLTDPELDLLRELLAEDPTDGVYLQVGEELVRRAEWAEAERVLRGGLAGGDDDDGTAWAWYARAALECAMYPAALEAWANAGAEQQAEPELARVRILALERSGRSDEALTAARAFLAEHGDDDVVVGSVLERLDAPAPPVDGPALRAADPWLTPDLAERYAAIGRVDRAIRVYRRILFRHPDQHAIRARLLQLDGVPADLPEDLSEELDDPSLVPPDLVMPAPTLASTRTEEPPEPRLEPLAGRPSGLADFLAHARQAERRVRGDDASDPPNEYTDPGDFSDTGDPDITSPLPGLAAMGIPTPKRRKKRSLLNR